MKRNKKGFTIVELVIVIGVIGILSAILIPTFANLTKEAQNAALKSDLAAVYSSYVADAADGHVDDEGDALEMYGQEEVALIKNGSAPAAGGEANFYVYRSTASQPGWQIAPVSYTEGSTAGKVTRLAGTKDYNGYAVYVINK